MQINVCRIHQIYESFWEHKLTALIIVVSSSDSEKFSFLETRNSGGLRSAPQFKDTDIILQNPQFFRLMIEDSWLLKAEHGPV